VSVVGIIPARHASTRFPGKALVTLQGKPMVQWVHEGASTAQLLDELLVATDDLRIRDCVEAFGGRALMTSPHHASGTDRLAEVAAGLSADVVVNVQGDEPLVAGEAIDALVRVLLDNPDDEMATLASPLRSVEDYLDPSVVKVVTDEDGRALYFSRCPVPYPRADPASLPSCAMRHVGLYAYRRSFLLDLASWPPSPLERCESLEQLRALEHGATIRVAMTEHESLAVDTPADVSRVEARLRILARTAANTGEKEG
jgi:3-deoxy-manno-octulosonate cytidylyltransferase (CMP-KDO synthetase)